MIRVAICDDNKPTLDFLSRVIDDVMNENGMIHETAVYLSGSAFLTNHRNAPYDVVFLDIVMPELNGFDVAKQLRSISKNTYIIFITTESSLVYDSFDFQPFYFIPKSNLNITEEKLKYVINKLSIHMAANEKILISGAYDSKMYISPEEVLFVQSNLNNIEYHLSNGSVQSVRGKIESILPALNSHIFARPHNRYLVNMEHIDNVDYPNMEITLDNGGIIRISRSYKKEFDEAYIRYMRDFS